MRGDIERVYNIINLDDKGKREFILKLVSNEGYDEYAEMPPIFIIEGMDGSGKGTYNELVVNHLISKGYNVLLVKEPSNFLRTEIYDSVNKKMDPWITAALFIWDRKHQFSLLSKEKYDEKTILLFDRSYLSTLVYQTAQGISFETLLSLHDFVPKHKLAFVFVCDPEVARKRVVVRSKETGKEIIDEFEKLEFLKKEKEGYEKITRRVDDCYLIDTTGDESDIPKIFERIEKVLDEKIDF